MTLIVGTFCSAGGKAAKGGAYALEGFPLVFRFIAFPQTKSFSFVYALELSADESGVEYKPSFELKDPEGEPIFFDDRTPGALKHPPFESAKGYLLGSYAITADLKSAGPYLGTLRVGELVHQAELQVFSV